jgi:hypothetical protein
MKLNVQKIMPPEAIPAVRGIAVIGTSDLPSVTIGLIPFSSLPSPSLPRSEILPEDIGQFVEVEQQVIL